MYSEDMTDSKKTPEVEAKPAQDAKLESKTKRAKPGAPKSPYAVVTRGVTDAVKVSVGFGSNKSLSTHHVQRRLAERGYGEVYRDRDGFWRDGTQDALDAFATDAGFTEGTPKRDVLASLFENDGNIHLEE